MKKFEKKSAGPLERLRLKSGIYAASFTVLAILLAVLLNLIVRAVPAKYTEFDLSEAGLYSLSDSSKEYSALNVADSAQLAEIYNHRSIGSCHLGRIGNRHLEINLRLG